MAKMKQLWNDLMDQRSLHSTECDRMTLMHACPYCKVRARINQYDMDESIEHHCTNCDEVWLQWPCGERTNIGAASDLIDLDEIA